MFMTDTDVAIVGGGLAGPTAAAMLGRAGVRTMRIDPHPMYPPDLRCEKPDGEQVSILRKTGLANAVLPSNDFRRSHTRRQSLDRPPRTSDRQTPGRPAWHSV
jgi:2-polyprenyl-6-methoxyphenol hydroxylase-like FAD-dependent oxidoreductase